MIYYKEFSTEEIFKDARLNVFFNQLYTYLINRFGFDRVQNEFLVDGMVALLMQEETPGPKFNKIEFSTADPEIFKYLKATSKALTLKSVEVSDAKIIITTVWEYKIYIKYNQMEMKTFIFNEIYTRHKSEIL